MFLVGRDVPIICELTRADDASGRVRGEEGSLPAAKDRKAWSLDARPGF